jgi:hypothetical protein
MALHSLSDLPELVEGFFFPSSLNTSAVTRKKEAAFDKLRQAGLWCDWEGIRAHDVTEFSLM